MKIRPLADKILIKNEKAETKTASGIYIPDVTQEKTQIGTVIAVGSGTDDVKITVKEGDKIMYTKYAGTKVKNDDEELLILNMSDIIAIVLE